MSETPQGGFPPPTPPEQPTSAYPPPPAAGHQAASAYDPPSGASAYGPPAGGQPTSPYVSSTDGYGQQPPAAPTAYPAQQGWGGQPGWGTPPPAKNGVAIAALVVGLVALVLCLIPFVNIASIVGGIAAVVLGVLGVRKARSGASGRGLGIAGIVLGAVSVVVAAVVLIFTALLMNAVQEEAERLEQIGTGDLGELDSLIEELEQEGADLNGLGDLTTELEELEEGLGDLADLGEPVAGPAGAVAFGDTYTWDNGLELTVSEPASYTPADSAEVSGDWAEYVVFDVTAVNGTGGDYEPFLWSTLSTAAAEAEEIFDAENGVVGPPQEVLPDGDEVTFRVVYGVDDPSTLTLSYVGGWQYDVATFER